MQPYSDRRATTYASFRPSFSCVPRGTESAHITSAELSTDVLNGYWDHLRADSIWRETRAWLVGTGNAFIQVIWDKEAGEFVVDEDGRVLYEGDLRLECVPPLQIDVDPFATRWADVRVVRKKTRRSLSWVRQRFPDRAHLVKSQDGEHNSFGRPEDDLLNIVGAMGYYSPGKTGPGYEGSTRSSARRRRPLPLRPAHGPRQA